MPLHDFECKECGHEEELFIDHSEIENLHICNNCGKIALKRVFRKMPGLTKASYIDSKKTARAASVDKLRTAVKLEAEMQDLPVNKRGEIKSEINKLRKVQK